MSRVRNDWSKLCTDLVRSILERLNTKDFHRARTVCSSWYSVSTTCARPLYPWRILLRKSSTLLFDPEQGKTIETEHPGTDFSDSCVVASCSNWLLIIDSYLDLYLLNVFTCERINLPSMSSLLFPVRSSSLTSSNVSACLWMNERRGDYVVAWSYKEHYLFLYKKGDDAWRNLQGTRCRSMAFKDNMLYVFTSDDYIKILDLAGDSANEIVEENPFRNHRFQFVSQCGEHVWRRKVAVTNSGEVLIVLSLKGLQGERLFCIFKMNFESGKWERVDTLGGEVLILGHGVTVRSPIKEINGEGIKSDSICFIDYDLWPGADYFIPKRQIKSGIFNLETSTITWPKTPDASFLKSFWFVPGYA